MLDRLPEFIDPLHLADKRGVLKGQIPLSQFHRLADVLTSDAGNIDIALFFGREGRLARIDGKISSILALECQNCLGPMEWVVDNDIKLGIVTSLEEADRLPEGYEPLLVEGEGKVLLKDIIEDELLLSLPDFPKHQPNCLAQADNIGKEDDVSIRHSGSETPFSILAKLKK